MNRFTSTISVLAMGLAMTGGAMAQENETLAHFEARCEASGYDDLDDCRSFMTMDTITNVINMPVADDVGDIVYQGGFAHWHPFDANGDVIQ